MLVAPSSRPTENQNSRFCFRINRTVLVQQLSNPDHSIIENRNENSEAIRNLTRIAMPVGLEPALLLSFSTDSFVQRASILSLTPRRFALSLGHRILAKVELIHIETWWRDSKSRLYANGRIY